MGQLKEKRKEAGNRGCSGGEEIEAGALSAEDRQRPCGSPARFAARIAPSGPHRGPLHGLRKREGRPVRAEPDAPGSRCAATRPPHLAADLRSAGGRSDRMSAARS